MAVQDITAKIAEFVSATNLDDIPQSVRSHVKLAILDTVGCGLYGSSLPWGRMIRDWALEWGGVQTSSVFGCPRKMPPPLAALVNGTMIHGFEMDDLHKESVIHLGSVAFPAALALGESIESCSGSELLCAVAVGYEVGARVGASIGNSHLLRGFHPTGTSGTFASSAAASRILGLGQEHTLHAIGIGATQGAGLMAAQYSAMVKRMHAGRAAQSGVYAATLASRGFTGIENVIEADYGGYCSTMAETADLERILRDIGQDWEAGKVTFKPYPCCGSNHTALDGLLEAASEIRVEPAKIRRVRVRTTTVTKKHVGWAYKPDSITAAQMNMYYCLAALLVDGCITVEQFKPERINDEAILRRIPDISVEADRELDALGPTRRHSIIIEIEDENGRRAAKRVDYSRGSPQKPMSREEVLQKFRSTAKAVGFDKAAELEDVILNLERLDSIGTLAALLREGKM